MDSILDQIFNSKGSGEELCAKVNSRLLFLRRDLQMHRLILEGDLFREYLAAAPKWLRAAYCLNDMVKRIKIFGFSGYFLDTGWWQLQAVEQSLIAVGAEGALNIFSLAKNNFEVGLDPDVSISSIVYAGTNSKDAFCNECMQYLFALLEQEEKGVSDWLKLMDEYAQKVKSGTGIAGVDNGEWTFGESVVFEVMPSPYSMHPI